MACFVCDEKPSNADTKADADNENSDCPRCGPSVTLNWKNGQRVLKHMGAHILHDGKVDSSIELCGLCLRPAPMCQFYLRKACGTAGSISIDRKKSSCINMIQFNYATASTSSEASPCSNVPITCPLCLDHRPAVWRYSLQAHFRRQHLLQSHSNFPIKVSLSQSEKDGMQEVWTSRRMVQRYRKSKPNNKPLLTISEAHRARLYLQ